MNPLACRPDIYNRCVLVLIENRIIFDFDEFSCSSQSNISTYLFIFCNVVSANYIFVSLAYKQKKNAHSSLCVNIGIQRVSTCASLLRIALFVDSEGR